MVAAEEITSIKRRYWYVGPSAGQAYSMRASRAMPAIFGAVERNAVTAVGAPWYTSGAQKWKGTKESLKPMPAMTSSSASESSSGDVSANPLMWPAEVKSRVPVSPYRNDRPYSITAEHT